MILLDSGNSELRVVLAQFAHDLPDRCEFWVSISENKTHRDSDVGTDASQPTTPPSNYKNKTPLITTGIDPKFNTPINIMSELRQHHPNLRVLQIKLTKNAWIFKGDTPKDFAILRSEPKMQQFLGKKVKMSLLKSYHSADAKKKKVLVFEGVSNNITLEDFKELLDFNKITHAEAERMKSKRTGRDLTFYKNKV